jgi:hypothetical protein
MTVLVHAAQHLAFKQSTSGTGEDGGQQQRWPKPNDTRQGVSQVSAEHVEAGMGEVQHAHHAEDEREARAEHEQQQAVAQAIEHGDQEKLHVQAFNNIETKGTSNPASNITGHGIFIWQLVGVLET